ncbi:amidohydrolase [Bacillus coreaensis]
MSYWIKNVRLETGYIKEDGRISSTKTECFHVNIQDGVYKEIIPADHEIKGQMDAKGQLMLPSFGQMHVHIDKTYFSGPWKAVLPVRDRFARIDEEKRLLSQLLPTAQERAENMLQHFLENGSTRVRTHCNIDQVIQLENLAITRAAVEKFNGKLAAEIVAFPQHGLLRSNCEALMRQAMRQGATIVGGVDPGTFDEDIEKSLYTTMNIAVENDARIDLHLHELGSLGIFTIKHLAKLVEEAGFENRVTISHAYCLGQVCESEAMEIADLLYSLGIDITSSVPMQATIPIPLLQDRGVKVELGTDNLSDHWSPFGTGEALSLVRKACERFKLVDERSIAQALGYITDGIIPLSERGERLWPQVGDKADAVIVQALCSAEAVARMAKCSTVIFNGEVVACDKEIVIQ